MQTHADHVTGSSFLPHGFCYLWNPELLWTHVIADLFIGAAYVTISVALAWLVHSVRRDIPFSWVFVAFGLFIITCGLTHFMEIWTMWQPVYWLSGGVKVVTAAASVATAIAMPFTVPRAVATIRDARLSRERELAEARAAVLQEQNELLRQETLAAEEARRAAEEARGAAEAADQSKSAFLRTMSHELRTPLNAILGYGQLLETGVTGPVTEAQATQLRRITSSGAHLLALIDDVLSLAQSGAAPNDVRAAAVDVPELIGEVAGMLLPQAMGKGLQLNVSAPPALTITTDAGKLRQTLLNLLTNAVKFTDAGSVSITAARADDAVLFRVSDTGPGIAPEHAERVFEPFWQVDQGTTRTHGGSGLGLSVSRNLMTLIGGTIELESEPGRGSTFTVRLPVAAD